MMIAPPSDDLARVLRAEHWDPFAVLGPHERMQNGKRFVVVRAFLPEAAEADLLGNGHVQRMAKVHEDGLFEGTLSDLHDRGSYRLKVKDRWGGVTERHDPYAFRDLISDFDLHLFAEGRLYRAYSLLGAHVIDVNGVSGVRFVVWAPNAMRVSVVGDFNGWDGRRHQMRSRGASGLWELFIPDLGDGAHYKYEIRSRDGGAPFLKADPYAFFAELRPKTAAIVHDTST